MIINKKVYTGIGNIYTVFYYLCIGIFKTIKRIMWIDKSETYRSLKGEYVEEVVLFPKIDDKKCNRCDECVKICPTKALRLDNDVIVCNISSCIRCGQCESECSKGALTLTGKYQVISTERDIFHI